MITLEQPAPVPVRVECVDCGNCWPDECPDDCTPYCRALEPVTDQETDERC